MNCAGTILILLGLTQLRYGSDTQHFNLNVKKTNFQCVEPLSIFWIKPKNSFLDHVWITLIRMQINRNIDLYFHGSLLPLMSVSHFLYNASISENGVEHDYFRIETGQSYRKEEKKKKWRERTQKQTILPLSSHSGVKMERALRQGDGMEGVWVIRMRWIIVSAVLLPLVWLEERTYQQHIYIYFFPPHLAKLNKW